MLKITLINPFVWYSGIQSCPGYYLITTKPKPLPQPRWNQDLPSGTKQEITNTRQALIDAVLGLYQCKPSLDRMKHYTANMQFEDPIVPVNGWDVVTTIFSGMPKLFSNSETLQYLAIHSESEICLELTQRYTVSSLNKSFTLPSRVYLTLHKEQGRGRIIRHMVEWYGIPVFTIETTGIFVGNSTRLIRVFHGKLATLLPQYSDYLYDMFKRNK